MTTSGIEELGWLEDWDEVRARLGELAGLDGPAPAAVTRRALEDRAFGFYLLFARESPTLKKALLEDPRNAAYERAAEKAPTTSLLGTAAKAFARWGAAGFKRLDAAAYDARWRTCLACPELVEAPDRLVYNGLTILADDSRVCSACGCVAAKKAAVPTEGCPLGKWPHPEQRD
ncbi:hypothetical protein [Actinomadura sp. 7K507]|uniref:hypothetical protein n=1 Tax=Actinomadura sp. 7K507 TaxID=2530365 RepID=UPI001049C148|nr:hypothetical protein [Actinomadura sp. 7K507]TDC94552.1 hypothetical protein E1285_08460 [Actinomadura sp. 7K507]